MGAEPLGCVTNSGGNSVSVIDTASNSVIATVAVGDSPLGVAVHPAATRVYVANSGGGFGVGTVSVIDTASNSVVATVPVGVNPHGVAVHPAGTRVYVGNRDDGSVSVIDTASNSVIATVAAVGFDLPRGVAVHPAGTRVYVTDLVGFSVIDTASNGLIAVGVPVGDEPETVAVHPAGTRVYVTNADENTVSVIDTASNSVIATVAVGNIPFGVAVNAAGTRAYVANRDDGTVSVIDTASNSVIAAVGAGATARGIAVTPCQVAVTRLSQCDPNWGGTLYDSDPFGRTICRKGCALTSLSMALNLASEKFNVNVFQNPLSLNSFMIETDRDYDNTNVNWPAAVRDRSARELRWAELRQHGGSSEKLDGALCQGNPVVVGVELDPQGDPGHFVLVTGRRGNDHLIADPAAADPQNPASPPRQTTLAGYGGTFVLRGHVSNPSRVSEIVLSVGDNAELLITDEAGRRTGFDPATQQDLMEIPESAYYRDAVKDDVTGEPATHVTHFLHITQPPQGTYRLIATGINFGPYEISLRAWSDDGTDKSAVLIEGSATVGSTDTYDLTFDPAPGQPVVVTKIGSPLSSLGPSNVWVGLKNSDDVGIRFDLRAEVYRNGTQLVGSGEIASVPGGSSGFNNAQLDTIPLTPVAGVTFVSGDTLSMKLLVRNACTGSGKNSGTARLWFNDSAADSRFDATIGNPAIYYLRDAFALATTPGPGPKKTIDVAAGAKCSPFKSLGTWNITMP